MQLSADGWTQLVGEPARVQRTAVYVDARLDLAHRRLLASGRQDPDYRLAEDLVRLVAGVVRGATDRSIPARDRPTPADRRVVAQARAAIHDGHPSADGLFPLARLLKVSPYRLSRSFSAELGVSVTRYRNRVRIGRAFEHLQDGRIGLAELAVTLGFADQAHFSRTLRQHAGATPAAVRHALQRVG